MKSNIKSLDAATVLLMLISPAILADSNPKATAKLMQQIERLEERIARLESTRSFTQFMPDFSERFHVLHRAGEAGDWAVAAHELQELKRLMEQAPDIDAENGKLMQAMLAPNVKNLDKAIEEGDHEDFEKVLTETVNTCNACHTATDSAFIQVTLDAPTTLSMRHPHKFMTSKPAQGHSHGMSNATPHMDDKMPQMNTETPHGDDNHHDERKPHDEKMQ